MSSSAMAQVGPMPPFLEEQPPRLVRLKRRLGLPVPVPWRPWVAANMLSKATLERQERRYLRWHAHRKQILVAEIVLIAIWMGTAFAAALAGEYVAVLVLQFVPNFVFLLLVYRQAHSKDPDPRRALAEPRVHALQWQGLLPDGSLDPHPDIWESLAGLPSWMVTVLAVLELAIGAAMVGSVAVGLALLATPR